MATRKLIWRPRSKRGSGKCLGHGESGHCLTESVQPGTDD